MAATSSYAAPTASRALGICGGGRRPVKSGSNSRSRSRYSRRSPPDLAVSEEEALVRLRHFVFSPFSSQLGFDGSGRLYLVHSLSLFLSLCRHPGASSDHGWNRQELEPCMDPASRPPPQDDGPMRMPTKVLNITTRWPHVQNVETNMLFTSCYLTRIVNCGDDDDLLRGNPSRFKPTEGGYKDGWCTTAEDDYNYLLKVGPIGCFAVWKLNLVTLFIRNKFTIGHLQYAWWRQG